MNVNAYLSAEAAERKERCITKLRTFLRALGITGVVLLGSLLLALLAWTLPLLAYVQAKF